jgi:hypothetical protein
MESEGISGQLYAHLVVYREVYGRGLASARVLNGHLLGRKLNIMFFGFVDDGAAEILIGVGRLQPDSGGNLRCDVAQVGLQFKVGDLAGSDLPAEDGGQPKNGQSEEEFGFPRQDNALRLEPKAKS